MDVNSSHYSSSEENRGLPLNPHNRKSTNPALKKSDPRKELNSSYIDHNRLLKAKTSTNIDKKHESWYLSTAILLSKAKEREAVGDLNTAKKLEFAALHGSSKVASIGNNTKDMQLTPVMNQDDHYHRTSKNNPLLQACNNAVSNHINYPSHEMDLIHSILLSEVIERAYPQAGLNMDIQSLTDFDNLVDQIFFNATQNIFPEIKVLINISSLLKNLDIQPSNLTKLIQKLEDIFLNKFEMLIKIHPTLLKKIGTELLSRLHLIAYVNLNIKDQTQSLLLTPDFLLESNARFSLIQNQLLQMHIVKYRQGGLRRELLQLIGDNGFRPSPEDLKKLWLSIVSLSNILDDQNIIKPELATSGFEIPQVSESMANFVSEPIFQKFHLMAFSPDAPPYVTILTEVTLRLFEGFEGMGVDKAFNDKGISDILQISYFRIQNAMNEAILHKNSHVLFQNEIEIIHQEIQNILQIMEPYPPSTLEKAISVKLSAIIPPDLNMKVHLKPSAMHSLSSVLSGIENEKGTNRLNVALLHNCYYESTNVIQQAKSYSIATVNGNFSGGEIKGTFQTPPRIPLDLYICEMHHNISKSRQEYTPENILGQVKAMYAENLVSDEFTVVIDTTMDLESSTEIKAFLNDPEIKQRILDGELNVVFIRSAQKFDMFGLDNYYGGISLSINNLASSSLFNDRMDDLQDQQRGLSYQGLTHLHLHAGDLMDKYRLGIMENTQKLYAMLPKKAVYHKGTTNPLQISAIKDKKSVFLDIKFPEFPSAKQAFYNQFIKYIERENILLTTRGSFGFSNTNFTVIDNENLRLNLGLDSDKTIDLYGQFFKKIQTAIELAEIETAQDLEILKQQVRLHYKSQIQRLREGFTEEVLKNQGDILKHKVSDILVNEMLRKGLNLTPAEFEARVSLQVNKMVDDIVNNLMERRLNKMVLDFMIVKHIRLI
jgi:hypothetical protein